MRFLIIDDDRDCAQSLQKSLLLEIPGVRSAAISYGFESAEVTLSAYVEGAMAAYLDLVILEAVLEGGSPTVLIRLIRKCIKMKEIPIWIYTASGNEEAQRACLIAGANKIVVKKQNGSGQVISYAKDYFLSKK